MKTKTKGDFRIMKKKIAILCSALMLATGASAFTGCFGGETEAEGKVMNVALNPEVEFVLDKDDKVVSVNAINEEGNLIISASAFENVEGKTAEEAAKLFVQVSKENGFLIEGNVKSGENEIKLSLSGDEKSAKELYNDVKASVSAYATELGITATVADMVAVTKAQLEQLVADCAPYLEQAEIQAMEYAELLNEIAESRKETAEFYSQELKNAYYEAKAFAMEQAELQVLRTKLGLVTQMAFDVAYNLYTTAVNTIENTRLTMLVNENSPYQLALQAFRTAKTRYLNYRNYVASLEQTEVTTAISERLANYQTVVDNAEQTLLNAGATANNALDTAKAQVTTTYEAVVGYIEQASIQASQFLNEIATAQTTAQAQFFTEFETNYAAAVTAAKNNWAAMSGNLQNNDNLPQE